MLALIEDNFPSCAFHSEQTALARTEVIVAVNACNARTDEYLTQSAAALEADPADFSPEQIFSGLLGSIRFGILQDELKARRLIDAFELSHRRNAQDALLCEDTTPEDRAAANGFVSSESHVKNRNRMANLETELRNMIQRQIAV